MEYHQTTVAQPVQDVYGHATRAGLTILQHLEQQGGGDFPRPPKFDNKHDEREYLKVASLLPSEYLARKALMKESRVTYRSA